MLDVSSLPAERGVGTGTLPKHCKTSCIWFLPESLAAREAVQKNFAKGRVFTLLLSSRQTLQPHN